MDAWNRPYRRWDLALLGSALLAWSAPSFLAGGDTAPVPFDDLRCLLSPRAPDAPALRITDSGAIGESGEAAPEAVLRRIADPENRVRYWVLMSAAALRAPSDALDILDDDFEPSVAREPAALRHYPVALLRDDDRDSAPDHAVLFFRDEARAVEMPLAERGCEFWRSPVSTLLERARLEHDWSPERAHAHRWSGLLDKIGEFGIWPLASRAEDVSVLDEGAAHRLFELVNLSLESEESGVGEVDGIWVRAQEEVLRVFSWMGLRARALSPPSDAPIRLEGVRVPVQAAAYRVPMLRVRSLATGEDAEAVFDPLLFNDWTTRSEWSRRLAQSPLQ